MTLLEEARQHLEKMREHTDCCGMPIFRRMVAELERREELNARFAGRKPPEFRCAEEPPPMMDET